MESWGDDLPDGKVTDFRRSVRARPDEAVIFAWAEYPDKITRDEALEAMTALTFGSERRVHGGFELINDSGVAESPGYLDGCLVPVPASRRAKYLEMADKQAVILKEHGATRIACAWSDDLPRGQSPDYAGAVLANGDEAVIFSWVEWPSKEARDRGWSQARQDPRIQAMELPFDGRRMIYGGFAPLLDG